MIIKSLAIENFQCYSGSLEDNTFNFRKGLNVIIGDNGSGKSKLYDAFYWVLYDKIFNSSTRELEPTSHVKINLLSDKAKANCEIGQTITARVVLTLEETKYNTTYQDEYRLERIYTIKKVAEATDFNDKSIWEVSTKSLTKIEKKDILDFKPAGGDKEFERITDKLLPNDMKPYLWFQGEQVDSLIDFKKEDSLTQAINVLSDITHYDSLIEIASKVFNQADTAYKSELRKHSKSNQNTDEYQKQQEALEKKIETDEINLVKIKQNLEYAELHKDELLGKIQDAQELETLKVEIKSAEENVKRINSQLERARKNYNSNIFSKKWLLRNAGRYVDRFELMLKEYDDTRAEEKVNYKIELQQEEARKNRLPEDVPNKVYLKDMLTEKHCFLCDRDFEEGDDAYNYISEILEKAKSNRVRFTDFLNNDLKKYFDTLLSNASYLNNNFIPRIDDSIREELERIGNIEDKKIGVREAYELIESKLKSLLATSKVDINESNNIVNQFRSFDSSKERFVTEQAHTIDRLKDYKIKLTEIMSALKSTLGNDMDASFFARRSVLESFSELAISTRDNVYAEQIKRIEIEANKHFYKMTAENSSVRGNIVLERRGKSYMPKNVDDNGIELTSINDSNLILIKLATIMAIVSAKGGTDFYPLISDAPTSKFSDNYTIGFCNTVGDVYNQSIIISYDFFHNKVLRDRLFKEVNNLGSVYEITPSIKEENRVNRTELSTNIKTLN
ncbi:MAG: AAA family ATPase [Marinilabiliaceae bacterium]|nr:AAA family ATPase [Marinilabiliaceae bacterium]